MPWGIGKKESETDRMMAALIKSKDELAKKVEEIAKKVERVDDDRKVIKAIGEKVLKMEKEGMPLNPAYEESLKNFNMTAAQIKTLEAHAGETDKLLQKLSGEFESVGTVLQSMQVEIQKLRSTMTNVGLSPSLPIEEKQQPASEPDAPTPPPTAPAHIGSKPRAGSQLVEVNPHYIKLSLVKFCDAVVKSLPVENQLAAKKAMDEAIPVFMKVYNTVFGREQRAIARGQAEPQPQ